MSKEQEFIKAIEKLRTSLVNRIDILHKHCEEYKEEGRPELAKESDLKSKQLIMVMNRLDKALTIVA